MSVVYVVTGEPYHDNSEPWFACKSLEAAMAEFPYIADWREEPGMPRRWEAFDPVEGIGVAVTEVAVRAYRRGATPGGKPGWVTSVDDRPHPRGTRQ